MSGLVEADRILWQVDADDVPAERVDPSRHRRCCHLDQAALAPPRGPPPLTGSRASAHGSWLGHVEIVVRRLFRFRRHIRQCGRRIDHRGSGGPRRRLAVILVPGEYEQISGNAQRHEENDALGLRCWAGSGSRQALSRCVPLAGRRLVPQRRHRIMAPRRPGMTPSDAFQRQPSADQRAMQLDCLHRIRGATRVVAAAGRKQRADHEAIHAQHADQRPPDHRPRVDVPGSLHNLFQSSSRRPSHPQPILAGRRRGRKR